MFFYNIDQAIKMYERYTKRITLGTDKCPILINTSKVFYCHLLGRSSKFIAPPYCTLSRIFPDRKSFDLEIKCLARNEKVFNSVLP